MIVRHLDCVSMCSVAAPHVGARCGRGRGRLVCHCLLVETDHHGLVLVDTGFGLRDVRAPVPRLSPPILALMKPQLREEDTAVRQVELLGYRAADVRHIVLTHLDFDHAGGLDDFPHARVHLLAEERDRARARPTLLDRMRYRPAQWSHVHAWRTYRPADGEPWFGFDAVRELEGLPPEILLIPLTGHTVGHAGVAVRRADGWLLHAGDAYFWHEEVDPERPRCPPGLDAYQRLMEQDRPTRLWNQERLRELRRDHHREVRLFCAHDVLELARMAALDAETVARSAALWGETPEA